MAFAGFGPGFFDFFRELKENNDRTWFEANKPRYEGEVKAVLMDFTEAIAEPLAHVSPHFIADPKKSLFRIHRDVRFSKDKSPYKTNGALHFRHSAGKDAHAPGFYLHLEPDQVFFGGGIWKPPAEPLRAIREAIVEAPDAWIAATSGKAFETIFGPLGHGDPLTRAPKGFDPNHPQIEDLKKRSFFAMANGDEDVAGQGDFVDRVAESYRAAAPMMAFLTGAVGVAF